jgi:plasmid stabilization system protein ParE
MSARILPEAEEDIESVFRFYETARPGLGLEMLDEFRKGVDQILRYPNAWHPLGGPYRRYRLHRFPYGIIYSADRGGQDILIIALMHLSRKPGSWRGRRP